MSFGEILDRWERDRRKQARRSEMDKLLERYPPEEPERRGEQREPRVPYHENRTQRLKRLKPQAVLDLHGMNSLEAEEALDRFIREAKSRGLEKVLIVHGKGNHSPGEPVLGRVVRAFLEKCPLTGAFGTADRVDGGRGASWVLLR